MIFGTVILGMLFLYSAILGMFHMMKLAGVGLLILGFIRALANLVRGR